MPQVSGNNQRIDPYRDFLFRVKVDGTYVAGVSKVTGLTRTVQVVRYREGGDPTPRVAPGQVQWGPITLERGITTDAAFTTWADTVWSNKGQTGMVGQGGAPVSLKDFRKTVIIEVYDVDGTKVKSYNVYNAWVSEFRAQSDLDAESNAVVIESLTIQNEGWELDNGSAS